LFEKHINSVAVKRDVQAGDEVGIRVKEQSIIELGKLFAKTRQAQGKYSAFFCAGYCIMLHYVMCISFGILVCAHTCVVQQFE